MHSWFLGVLKCRRLGHVTNKYVRVFDRYTHTLTAHRIGQKRHSTAKHDYEWKSAWRETHTCTVYDVWLATVSWCATRSSAPITPDSQIEAVPNEALSG